VAGRADGSEHLATALVALGHRDADAHDHARLWTTPTGVAMQWAQLWGADEIAATVLLLSLTEA
jgi:hypothetical protein